MRVLIDGRVDAPVGIGRYPRCAVAAVRAVAPSDVAVRTLNPTGTPGTPTQATNCAPRRPS